MRVLDTEKCLARIYIGEAKTHRHQPLFLALLTRLQQEGFTGATALRGVAGFGAHRVLHSTHLLRLSEDLPVIVEVVDSEERVEQLLPILDEMVGAGLVTIEKVRALRYGEGSRVQGRPEGG